MQNKELKDKLLQMPLEAIFNIAVDAIISIDSEGIISAFNPAAEKLFGYSSDEAIGLDINDLMPEIDNSEDEKIHIKTIIGIGRETVAKHKDGSVFPVRISVGESRIDDEQVYFSFIQDISEIKKQEFELKEHRDHLQALVEQRNQELSLVNEKLCELANQDSLTNLPNRRYFDETFHKEIQRATRHKHPLSLLMCDIDFFKQYNDTYGHIAGDECLVSVAECLSDSCKRASDFPARYGGEEFTVILPHTDNEDAVWLSEAILENLKMLAIPHGSSDISDTVTISIGLVTLEPDAIVDSNEMIKVADEALYKAKRNGRNRIEVSILQ